MRLYLLGVICGYFLNYPIFTALRLVMLKVDWPAGAKDACAVIEQRGLAGLEVLLAGYLEMTHE